VNYLALSPDGSRLASGGDDWNIRIWDLATGQELLTLKPNGGKLFGVAFSHDGGRIAAASFYGLVTVWDARPLTADIRTELVAADLLDRLLPRVQSDDELIRLIRERSSIDEAVRRRALEMASFHWKTRSSAKPSTQGRP